MAALSRIKMADIQYVGSSAGSLYANGSGQTSLIAGLTLYNGNTTDEVVHLYVVPDSASALGTAGVSNKIGKITLAPDETYFFGFDFPVVLTDQNDSVQASTTTASKVTVIVHGDRWA